MEHYISDFSYSEIKTTLPKIINRQLPINIWSSDVTSFLENM